ncbi:MAG: hydroxysqualene dehydroxylase HpnE [Armatimonadota bacterium]
MGGGVAGLSCACELADAGLNVTVLEAKKHLGGRAHSFRDKETGMSIDNCQHILLGCCDAAIGFLTKIGSIGQVEFHDEISFIGAKGRVLEVRSSFLPAPVHLVPSILKASCLSGRNKIELGRVFARVLRTEPRSEQVAQEYLKALGCSAGLIACLIDPILIAALNEPASDASAQYSRMVLKKSLLESKCGYRLGVPNAPLSHIIDGPAVRYLSRRGCKARTSAKVEKLNIHGGKVESVILAGGTQIRSDYYVCAVPPWSLAEIGYANDAGQEMHWRSIKSVHLFYEVADFGFERACMAGEPFGWVFNKTHDFGLERGYIQAVASGADSLENIGGSELIELAQNAVDKAAGRKCRQSLRRAVIYNAHRATFATLRCDALRPSAKTHISNLYLAGDWTDTGWPATIEGAVRSGLTASNQILSQI